MADKPIKLTVEEDGVKQTTRDVKGLSSSLGGLKGSAGLAFAAIASGAVAAGLGMKSLIDGMVDTIDEMNTLGNAADLSTELMNGLRLVADSTGKSLADLVPKNLPKRLREARDSAGAARDGFLDLGFSMEEINNLDTDEVYLRMIERLNTMDDSQEAAAISAELLGKNGREMMSAFSEGRKTLEEAVALTRDFGYDVGPKAQQAASKWQAATGRLNLTLENTQRQMAPVTSLAATLIEYFGTGLVAATTAVSTQVGELGTRLALLYNGDINGFLDRFNADATGLIGTSEAVAEAMDKWLNVQTGITDPSGEGSLPKTTENAKETAEAIGQIRSSVEAALPSLSSLQLELSRLQGDEPMAVFWQLDVDLARLDETVEAITKARDKANDPAKVAEYNDALAVLADQRVQLEKNASDRVIELTSEETKKRRKLAFDMVSSMSSAFSGLTDSLLTEYDKQGEGSKKAAQQAFRNRRAANVGQILVDTIGGVSRQFVDLPFPAAMFTSTLIAAAGAINAQQAGAQQMPSFHIGTRTADEVNATLLRGEGVVSRAAVESLGGPQAVADLNAGVSQTPSGMAVVIDGRTAGYAVVRQMDQRQSQIAGRMRRERTTRMGRRY